MKYVQPAGPQVDLGDRISNALGNFLAQNTATKMDMRTQPNKDGAYYIYIGWREHSGYERRSDKGSWCDPEPILEIRIKVDQNPPIIVTYECRFAREDDRRKAYGTEEAEVRNLIRRIGGALEHFIP